MADVECDMLKPLVSFKLTEIGALALPKTKKAFKKELEIKGRRLPAYDLRGCAQAFGCIPAGFEFRLSVIADSLRKVEEHSGVVLRLAKRD
ncbi:hypothetical protein [Bacillus subtilis]|uniref:hypothetical protein n=1 Tax=Bacillus subtilis TaxID=1423 RepID=UPI0027960536|nr:hypothetical protein [Bacillus subtilis]